MRGFFLVLVLTCLPGLGWAQSAAELSKQANLLNRYALSLESPQREAVLGDVRRILDRVRVEHPASAEAQIIAAQGLLGELDVRALYSGVTAPAAIAPSPIAPAAAVSAVAPPMPADPKARLKAIQERLNAVGCKAGTADGVSGARTMRGYRAFLEQIGLSEESHPIDSAAFWTALQSASEPVVCETMPAVPVNVNTVDGNWSFVARCGPRSKIPNQRITGIMSIQHVGGGNFRGTLKNSQGLTGRVTASLSGRRVTAETNFGFLLGRVSFSGSVAEHAYVVSGTDSNGCRFTTTKR
jgi:hypothetical protein